jgi:nicotinamidase/pyrazinamidase
MEKKALIIVDMQNDFCPGGALAVKDGDRIVPLINELQNKLDLVVATQDWHPKNHKSFASNHGKQVGEVIELNGLQQILWPDHCVQGTAGAELRKDLDTTKIEKIFQKGTDPSIDSYSGFFDNGHKKATGLGEYLKTQGVASVFVTGLATDYCVKFTALDAVGLGFKTYLIKDACRGVNLEQDDADRAIEELQLKGVGIINANDL